MEHPYFIKFDEKSGTPYISVPLLAKYVREHMEYILVRDNGKQVLQKYIYEGGCYRYYADNMIMGRIKQYIADYDEELDQMEKVADALNHINTDLNYVSQDDLNADEDIINFQNTLPKITPTELIPVPHTPDIYSTIQIPRDWIVQDIPTPAFDRYIDKLADGDKELIQLLLEFVGVCISNIKGYRMKKALFLVSEGETGKSQIKSLVEMLLGKGNFIGINLKEIESRFGTGAVYNTRLAKSSDMSFLSVDELKTFKKMTDGDSLYAEFKGQQAFEFTYNGLLWFCMNRLPKFGGDDGKWVYERIMVVECKNECVHAYRI
jgi:phage/plasmid-associated DNA primase